MEKLKLTKDKTYRLDKAGVKSIHLADECMAGLVLLIELNNGKAIGINGDSVALYSSLESFLGDGDKDEMGNPNVLDGLDIDQ